MHKTSIQIQSSGDTCARSKSLRLAHEEPGVEADRDFELELMKAMEMDREQTLQPAGH